MSLEQNDFKQDLIVLKGSSNDYYRFRTYYFADALPKTLGVIAVITGYDFGHPTPIFIGELNNAYNTIQEYEQWACFLENEGEYYAVHTSENKEKTQAAIADLISKYKPTCK